MVDSKPRVETRTSPDPAQIAPLGGRARAAALSPEERKESARRAAAARWQLPRATHEGVLKFGDVEFPCYVLDNGERVISETRFMESMGMYRSGALSTRRGPDAGNRLPLHLAHKNLAPYIEKHLGSTYRPLRFLVPTGSVAAGIPAVGLNQMCEIWLDARKDGVLRQPRQKLVADRADMVLRALAKVGIIALVDEATGFQKERDAEALRALLDKYLRREFAAWARRFPQEFYEQIFRLRGWTWKGMRVNRPQAVANYTRNAVYERLAPGILKELEQRNPTDDRGRRRAKHHQWLTEDIGHPALAQHLHAVIGLMRASDTWAQFQAMLDRAFPKRGDSLQLDLFADPPQAPAPQAGGTERT
jgi:hypothetical protein